MTKHKRTTPKIFKRAKELRRDQTETEAKLWAYLRRKRLDGVKFRRQRAIGNYIVDFCAPRHRLIIELDGGGHLDREEYDARRTEFLESHGYKVLRIWNSDVSNNINEVIREIQHVLKDRNRP